jgi:signal transduction histidine kinase
MMPWGIIRRVTVRVKAARACRLLGGAPGRSTRDRRGGPTDAADRLSALTHELRNLLDGSLRWLSITSRGLPEPSDHPGDELLGEEIERTRKRLETVRLALVQMNNLVAGSMKAGLSLGSPAFAAAERVSLAEALDHAADVVRPRAASLGIDIAVELDERAGPRAAGPMYTVMLNGLHNAIDSVERRLGKTGDGARGGKVLARLAWSERGGLSRAALFIEDDGEGPPDLDDPGAVFDPGYSSKGAGGGHRAGAEPADRDGDGRADRAAAPRRRGRGAAGGLPRARDPRGGGDPRQRGPG